MLCVHESYLLGQGIEFACKRYINFIYLLEGKHELDHVTIVRFCSLHVAPLTKELFAQFDSILADRGELSLVTEGTVMTVSEVLHGMSKSEAVFGSCDTAAGELGSVVTNGML